MHRFEEEEAEPVAVVRTLSDFALALTLVVLMLIGTRSATDTNAAANTHAASAQPGAKPAELTLQLTPGGKFTSNQSGGTNETSAGSVAARWVEAHPNVPATILVQFAPTTLAGNLHRGLLELQTAFGTNLVRIDTVPQP